jgi:FAD/FMN-containing dehydrogenase
MLAFRRLFHQHLERRRAALAMKIVARTQCKFAIRSGGHMSNQGFGGVDESGVVFDLGALNEITLSQKRDIVSVGPGATWGLVYEALEKYELTVGGFIPGGLSFPL